MKQTIIHPFRMVFLSLIPVALMVIFVLSLYNLQIVNGEAYEEQSLNNIVTNEIEPAARGGIFDRYGRPLVGSRVSYNLLIDREKLVASGDPNGWLLKIIKYANELEVDYTDNFPIERVAPFDRVAELTDTQMENLTEYLKHFRLPPEYTGAELLKWMRTHYLIPEEYSDEDARTVAGVRYEMEFRALFSYSPYYFTEDVSYELMVVLEEQQFPGISRVAVTVPEYYTKYAAQLLGRVGPMNADEYERYREDGYAMNVMVGKDGLEAAFESELHGSDGIRKTTRNQNGEITVRPQYTVEPNPGNNIRTTLDIELQQILEQSLELTSAEIDENRLEQAIEDGENPDEVQLTTGAAAVVMHVKTGDVLACASYPTYDITTMTQPDEYARLTNPASNNPIFNRAIMGRYEPGSTFKVVTAIAGLDAGVISEDTIIHDAGKFEDAGIDYQPTCAIYPYSHGDINIVDALAHSCNYFFYVIGYEMGIELISDTAEMFGINQKTGIELENYERTGIIASKNYKLEALGEQWVGGDTLQAAMGQSYNLFTPIQLASYCATIANDGERVQAHFLKEIKSHDDSTIITRHESTILNKMDVDPYYFKLIKDGMKGSANYGTASEVFGSYPIQVACKTGTVQLGEDLENNAVFMAFAPADNPEIAVAVVVEKGGSGSGVAGVARDVFDHYFASSQPTGGGLPDDGVLLR